MTLHLNLPGSSHRHNSSEQQQEVREARRLLKERIRNDWDYPTLPRWTSSGRQDDDGKDAAPAEENRVAGLRFHSPHSSAYERTMTRDGSSNTLGLDFEPAEWRERVCSSEEETETDDDTVMTGLAVSEDSRSSTFKFESPESVGMQLADQLLAKKRKRSKMLEGEMEWNDGLAHWSRRRDAWCCARTASQVRHNDRARHETSANTTPADSTSASSSPRTSTSSTATTDAQLNSTPCSSLATTPDLPPHPPTQPQHIPSSDDDLLLLPLAPPLLPNHPIRRRLNPSMYPEIYAKIILQSRTPSVPINLAQLVAALVQGWKTDGEWPPKDKAVEKSIAGPKKKKKNGGTTAGHSGHGHGHAAGLKEGVMKVGRVLRLTGTSGGHGEKEGGS